MGTEHIERRTCNECATIAEHCENVILTPGPPFSGWVHLHFTRSHDFSCPAEIDDFDFCSPACTEAFLRSYPPLDTCNL